MLIFLTALAFLVLGYPLWLGFRSRGRSGTPPPPPTKLPPVEIVIPVYNEIRWIEEKLRNVSQLRYPRELLRIWLVDGASSDGTAEVAARWVRLDPRFELIRLHVAHKTAQLNAALRRIPEGWVMVTDVDTRLQPETLSAMVRAGEADHAVAAVGITVEPWRAHPFERLHWEIANRLRLRESRRGCASIVTGPCYLFRRDVVQEFPGDVVADDVHVALAAAASGRRVMFLDLLATELRSPVSLRELFWHKHRKAKAYFREIFRFLPRATRMGSPARGIFLWRAAQMTMMPILLVAGAGFLLGALWGTGLPGEAHWPAALGAALVGAATWLGWRSGARILTGAGLGLLLTVVLLTALATWRFSRGWHPRLTVQADLAGRHTG